MRVWLDPFQQSRLERNQPHLTLWDLILETGLGEHAGLIQLEYRCGRLGHGLSGLCADLA
jgi:hypothetical protein